MTYRAFEPEYDVPKLQAFLAEMRQRVGQANYFQFGDLIWRICYWRNEFNPATDLCIWERDNGQIDGFLFDLRSDNNPEFFVRPELYETALADEMVYWAITTAEAAGKTTLETSCIEGDEAKASFLRRHEFQKTDDVMVFMQRNMETPLPEVQLPPEYTIVSYADRPDLPGVTNTPMTAEQHKAIVSGYGYRDELGLRVCHQGREIVSGGICWYDSLDSCGELEPIGTVKEHRGKGLAFAVITQLLTNLNKLGAKHAYVRTQKDNEPAVRLYQKLGFHITDEDVGWVRNV